MQIILGKGNASLENETVKHLNIQPDHKVLGFGAGIGLNAALKKVEHSSGKVYGIDISEQIQVNCLLRGNLGEERRLEEIWVQD